MLYRAALGGKHRTVMLLIFEKYFFEKFDLDHSDRNGACVRVPSASLGTVRQNALWHRAARYWSVVSARQLQ
jgi:hypothetical protein